MCVASVESMAAAGEHSGHLNFCLGVIYFEKAYIVYIYTSESSYKYIFNIPKILLTKNNI